VHGVAESLGLFMRWARLQLHQRIEKITGISIDRSAVVILETLHRDGPMRMSELANKIGLDRSTVSRQVAAVTAAGLVEKSDDTTDARAAVLSLSARGQSVRHKFLAGWQTVAAELIAAWSLEEQAEFSRLMSKLANQLRD
jgi:DNA-binding MarR family transcriptional regulator